MKLTRLRISEIGTNCAAKTWFVLTVGYKPPGFAIHLGNCFHKAQGKNLSQKAETKQNLETEEVVETFKFHWDKEKNRVAWTSDDPKPRIAKAMGTDLTAVYYEELCKSWQPIVEQSIPLVEYPLSFKIDDKIHEPLEITGTIDIELESGIIVDHKTAQRAWSEGRENSEIQGHLYPFGMKLNGFDVKGFQFGIGYARKKTKSKKKSKSKAERKQTELRPVQHDESMVNQFLNQAISMAEMFRKESPVKNFNGWWCNPKYCGFYDICRKVPTYSFTSGTSEPTKPAEKKDEDIEI